MHPQVFTLVHSGDVITFVHGSAHGGDDTYSMCAHRGAQADARSHIKLSRRAIYHNFFFFPLSFLPDYSKCESKIEPAAGLITGDVGIKLPSTRAHRD